MTDNPPKAKADTDEKGKDPFCEALALAKVKAVAARAILNSSRVPPQEAAGPLLTGWRQIARAVEQIKKESQEHASLTLEKALGPGGILHRPRSVTVDDIDALTQEHSRYVEGRVGEFTLAKWRQIEKDLEYALLCLKRWHVKHRAGKKTKVLHLMGRIALGIGALAAVAAVVIGLVITFVQPKKDDGLTATYFVKPNFTGHFFNRIDSTVDFDWGSRAPLHGVPANNFSVRWEGCVHVEEHPVFLVSGSDDGMQVFVDGALVIDNGGHHKYANKWAEKALPPGTHSIRVDFVEGGGAARAFLGWSKRRGVSPKPIPYSNLVPKAGNARRKCPYVPAGKKPLLPELKPKI